MGRKKQDTANRPSQKHMKYVRRADGTKVLNTAFEGDPTGRDAAEHISPKDVANSLGGNPLVMPTQEGLQKAREAAELLTDPEQCSVSTELNDILQEKNEIYRQAKDDYDKAARRKGTTEKELLGYAKRVQEAGLDAACAREDWEDYQNNLADAFEGAEEGIPVYRAATLGTATLYSTAQDGTLEWLRDRQTGIGGSDMLTALGYHNDYRTREIKEASPDSADMEDLIASKVLPITDRDVECGQIDVFRRGHQFEPALIAAYQDTLPDGKKVVRMGGMMRGPEEWQLVNVDGVILDSNGQPEGLIECKTATHPWKGVIPTNYRVQALNYMDATGLPYTKFLVNEAGENHVYQIFKDEPITGLTGGLTFADVKPRAAATWQRIQEAKKHPETVKSSKDYVREPIADISPHATARSRSMQLNNHARQVSALLGGTMSAKDVRQDIETRMASNGDSLDSAVRGVLRDNFSTSNLGVMVGVGGKAVSPISHEHYDGQYMREMRLPQKTEWANTTLAIYRHGRQDYIDSHDYSVSTRTQSYNPKASEGHRDVSMGTAMDDNERRWADSTIRNSNVTVGLGQADMNSIEFNTPSLKCTGGRPPHIDANYVIQHFAPRGENSSRYAGLKGFAHDLGVHYDDSTPQSKTETMMECMSEFFRSPRWMDGVLPS